MADARLREAERRWLLQGDDAADALDAAHKRGGHSGLSPPRSRALARLVDLLEVKSRTFTVFLPLAFELCDVILNGMYLNRIDYSYRVDWMARTLTVRLHVRLLPTDDLLLYVRGRNEESTEIILGGTAVDAGAWVG